MGLDISAMSADEIAISIVAKLISVKNNKTEKV
jgi:xanthine/CO dehydrogenase XdhC/CoxF family maturation factor